MNENYYKILGVNKDATIEEIKKAYKTKVKQYHPDVNNNSNSNEMFIKIKLAYDKILESRENNATNKTKEAYHNSNYSDNTSNDFSWSEYNMAENNFDIDHIDPKCVFIGDIYTYKYKLKYDYSASFEEQTYKKLIKKNVILLRVGFEEYIDLSKLKNKFVVEQVQKKLNDKAKREKIVILGDYFKPYADMPFATNIRPSLNYIHKKTKGKRLIKR